jgi:iron-sulfur cluster repair protein YtfE (RIC family)
MQIKTNKELTEDFQILRKDFADLVEHKWDRFHDSVTEQMNRLQERLNKIEEKYGKD